MIALPKDLFLSQVKNLGLIYWQVHDETQEISRQDEDLSQEDSFIILSDLLDSLTPYAKPNERLRISMQSIKSTSKGKAPGAIQKKYVVALTSPIQVQGIAAPNYNLQRENEELKIKLLTNELKQEHARELDIFRKRIEALEAEPEGNDLDKTIGHLNTLLAHPLAQLLVGQFLATPTGTQPPINGVPEEGKQIFEEWQKIDPEAIHVMKAIVKLATEQPQQYAMYKPLLLK